MYFKKQAAPKPPATSSASSAQPNSVPSNPVTVSQPDSVVPAETLSVSATTPNTESNAVIPEAPPPPPEPLTPTIQVTANPTPIATTATAVAVEATTKPR